MEIAKRIEKKYEDMGLKTRRVFDKPGTVYAPHAHHKVYLYSLGGSAQVKLDDGQWQDIVIGKEIIINDGQLHEAVAGPTGWEYIFAEA